MRRKAVPQSVRGNILNSRVHGVTPDHGPRKVSRKRPPTMQENIWRRRLAITRFHRGVLLQPVNRTLPERHAALLISLAMTNHEPREQINVRLLQLDELRHA